MEAKPRLVVSPRPLVYTFCMVKAHVSFDENLYQAAREEAARQGISFAELCRQALADALEHRDEDKPWMRFSGILEGDDPDASLTVNEVVYNRETP